MAPDAELKEVFEGIHESLALLLAAVAGMHILAAFKHALIDRDGVLRRMTSTVDALYKLFLFNSLDVSGVGVCVESNLES